jgi:hypothetical protein
VRTDHLLNLHVFLSELTRRPVRVTRTLQQAFVRQADVWGLYRFPPRRAHTSRVGAGGTSDPRMGTRAARAALTT